MGCLGCRASLARLPSVIFSTVGAPGRAGFPDNDCTHAAELWSETSPDPSRQDFARWIFEPVDLVEVVVIQLRADRLEGRFQVREVNHPPEQWVDRTGDVNLASE